MISEIIGDKHKMKRKHLSLFSGFHRGYTETVCDTHHSVSVGGGPTPGGSLRISQRFFREVFVSCLFLADVVKL